MRNLFIYILISTIFCGVGNHLFADIVGITWDDSRLVSFDPYSGAFVKFQLYSPPQFQIYSPLFPA